MGNAESVTWLGGLTCGAAANLAANLADDVNGTIRSGAESGDAGTDSEYQSGESHAIYLVMPGMMLTLTLPQRKASLRVRNQVISHLLPPMWTSPTQPWTCLAAAPWRNLCPRSVNVRSWSGSSTGLVLRPGMTLIVGGPPPARVTDSFEQRRGRLGRR